jgi:hypothetical protein
VDFVTEVTRGERLWEGARGDEQEGRPASELDGWLEQRQGRPVACLGAAVANVACDETLATELRYAHFVPALLHDPELRDRYRDAVEWERAERMLEFGGIRTEDNVLVTDGGPRGSDGRRPRARMKSGAPFPIVSFLGRAWFLLSRRRGLGL